MINKIIMGLVYADIELINADDLAMVRRYKIGEEEVRRMTVKMMVDTGSVYMCINETVQEQLDLAILERRKGQLADGSIVEYDVVGPIEVKFKNRRCVVDAMVLPGDNEMLLGAIPLEDMDILIHPHRQELIVNPDHPYVAQMKMKSVFTHKKM
jgi:clan AA aspartic protease